MQRIANRLVETLAAERKRRRTLAGVRLSTGLCLALALCARFCGRLVLCRAFACRWAGLCTALAFLLCACAFLRRLVLRCWLVGIDLSRALRVATFPTLLERLTVAHVNRHRAGL